MARTRECDMDGPLMLIVVWELAVRKSTLFAFPVSFAFHRTTP